MEPRAPTPVDAGSSTSNEPLDLPSRVRRARCYKPKNSSLSALELLPAGLRITVFEIVFEIERPLQVRKCCKIWGDKWPCKYHKSDKKDPSRLPLLEVSRDVKQDVTWVLHNRIKIYTEVPRLLLMKRKTLAENEWRVFDSMWRTIAKSRFLMLELPLPGSSAESGVYYDRPHMYTTALFDCLERLFQYWGQQGPYREQPAREVSIQLGSIFEKYPLAVPQTPERQRLLKAGWHHLGEWLVLIDRKQSEGKGRERDVEWTVCADLKTKASNMAGRKGCKKFMKVMRSSDVKFGFLPDPAIDISDYPSKSRGASGGTHSRFLD